MLLNAFLVSLFEKAGIPVTDPAVAPLLAHADLNRIEVPDAISGKVQQSLLSVQDAINNHPTIKTHYFKETMSNVERGLSDAYKAAGFTDEEIAEFNKETSATKRIPIVVAALKAKAEGMLEEAKKGGGKPADTEPLKQQVKELNEQLARIKEEATQKEEQHSAALATLKKETKLSSKLAAFKTVIDHLPEEVKFSTINNLLSKELSSKGAELTLDENGNFKLLKKDGTEFYDDTHKLVSPDDFISKVLAENKVLQQNNTASDAQNGATGEPRTTGTLPGGQRPKTDLSGIYNQTREALNQAPVSVV